MTEEIEWKCEMKYIQITKSYKCFLTSLIFLQERRKKSRHQKIIEKGGIGISIKYK